MDPVEGWEDRTYRQSCNIIIIIIAVVSARLWRWGKRDVGTS